MRSESGGDGQACLPFDLPPETTTVPSAPRARRASRPRSDAPFHHLLSTDVLASLGWPAGTELTLTPSRTPRRGQVVLAREGTELKIGVFEVQLGRAALRTDHGSVWLGGSADLLGTVTLASPPLAEMWQVE